MPRDDNFLVPAGFPAADNDPILRDRKGVRNKGNHRLIGFAIDRRRGQIQFDPVADDLAPGIATGPRLYFKPQDQTVVLPMEKNCRVTHTAYAQPAQSLIRFLLVSARFQITPAIHQASQFPVNFGHAR